MRCLMRGAAALLLSVVVTLVTAVDARAEWRPPWWDEAGGEAYQVALGKPYGRARVEVRQIEPPVGIAPGAPVPCYGRITKGEAVGSNWRVFVAISCSGTGVYTEWLNGIAMWAVGQNSGYTATCFGGGQPTYYAGGSTQVVQGGEQGVWVRFSDQSWGRPACSDGTRLTVKTKSGTASSLGYTVAGSEMVFNEAFLVKMTCARPDGSTTLVTGAGEAMSCPASYMPIRVEVWAGTTLVDLWTVASEPTGQSEFPGTAAECWDGDCELALVKDGTACRAGSKACAGGWWIYSIDGARAPAGWVCKLVGSGGAVTALTTPESRCMVERDRINNTGGEPEPTPTPTPTPTSGPTGGPTTGPGGGDGDDGEDGKSPPPWVQESTRSVCGREGVSNWWNPVEWIYDAFACAFVPSAGWSPQIDLQGALQGSTQGQNLDAWQNVLGPIPAAFSGLNGCSCAGWEIPLPIVGIIEVGNSCDGTMKTLADVSRGATGTLIVVGGGLSILRMIASVFSMGVMTDARSSTVAELKAARKGGE
ncbi:MAG: hypothetical protein QM804_15655 [Propionicimonas sp.]